MIGDREPLDLRDFVRQVVERLKADHWIEERGAFVHVDPMSIAKAFVNAMDAALIGRAKTEAPTPHAVAMGFLVATVNGKGPMSERLEAASLLLGTKP